MAGKHVGRARPLTRVALAVALMVALVVAVGCGSSDTSGGGSSTGGDSGSSEAVTVKAESGAKGTGTQTQVTDFQAYFGGKGGKASGEPIDLGFFNTEGGQLSFPDITEGAKAAVRYINDHGGVRGRPLKLVPCFASSAEEEGQKCGQKFFNDEAMPITVGGQMAIGAASYDAALQGRKPTVMGIAATPPELTLKNGFSIFGTASSFFGPIGTYIPKVLKGDSAAFVYHQAPDLTPVATQIQRAIEAGVKTKAVGYQGSGSDLIGPLTAAGARDASAVVLFPLASDCVQIANALKQGAITTPVIVGPMCLTPDVGKALGDLPKWTYLMGSLLPSDASQPGVRAYQEAVAQGGMPKPVVGSPLAVVGFANVMFAAKMLNEVGPDAGTDALVSAIKDYTGPVVMGPPNLKCGVNPQAPVACNDKVIFYSYEGNGRFTRRSDFLGPASAQ